MNRMRELREALELTETSIAMSTNCDPPGACGICYGGCDSPPTPPKV